MRKSIKPQTVIAALAAGILLAGCSGGGSDTQTSAPIPPVETTVSPAPSSAGPATTTDDSASTGMQDSPVEAGLTAVALAEAEVPGSQAISLDWDDDQTWSVDVISGDQKHEIKVNSEGTEILETEQESADSEDIDRLPGATTPISDAIRTALVTNPGEFDEADLEMEGNSLVWKVEIDNPDTTVYVDAATGEIINL